MTQRFAVLYADGSVHEGGGPDDELVDVTLRVSRDWLEAPDDGVLFVVADEHKTKSVTLQGADFYFPFEGGEGFGFADYLGPYLRGNLRGLIKFGEYVSGARYVEILQAAKARQLK